MIEDAEKTCDAKGCYRKILVNGLCEHHLDESGWHTKTLRIPLLIREWVEGMLAEEGGQRNDASLVELAERIGHMPTSSEAPLAVNLDEAAIISDEVGRILDLGDYILERMDDLNLPMRGSLSRLAGKAYAALQSLRKTST